MRSHPIQAVAVVLAFVLAGAGVAYAASPVVVHFGNLVLSVKAATTPSALPKHRRAPIGFTSAGRLGTADGSHPPAASEAIVEIDRDVEVDVSEFPVCPRSRIEFSSTEQARHACAGAILGEGKTTVEVAFPDQPPFQAKGPLTLFNGGARGGLTTLYVQAYVAIPLPTAVVIPVKLRRVGKGAYGIRSVSKVPLFAGGSGSVVSFELNGSRFSEYKGQRRSWAFARCPDGRTSARISFRFRGGPTIGGGLLIPCKGTG